MTELLILAACILTGTGCYYLSCAIADVPTSRTSRMMLLSRKQTGNGKENLFDVYLTRVAEKCSILLHLDPVRKGKLSQALSIAGLSITPETYTMKALLSAFTYS